MWKHPMFREAYPKLFHVVVRVQDCIITLLFISTTEHRSICLYGCLLLELQFSRILSSVGMAVLSTTLAHKGFSFACVEYQ